MSNPRAAVGLVLTLALLVVACSSSRDRMAGLGSDGGRLGIADGGSWVDAGAARDMQAPPADTPDPAMASEASAPDAGAQYERPPDAGPLVDDEPDVEPDERPSDDPSSAGWMDPPAPSGACCHTGSVVGIDDVEVQASSPVAAWDGEEWGVAWRIFETGQGVFRRLDASASPTTGLRELGLVYPTALAWGNGRFGLLGAVGVFLVLDREGAPRATTVVPSAADGGDVTRHPLVHGWALATYADRDGGVTGFSRLVVLDETFAVRADRDLGMTRYADVRSLAVVSLVSRLTIVQATGRDIRFRPFVGPDAVEAEGVSFDPGRVTLDRHTDAAAALGAVRFRDHVVAVVHGPDALISAVFDPFAATMISGPNAIVPSDYYRSPGVAADDVGGTIGVCYPEGPAELDANEIRFVLLDPAGLPLGEPVTIAGELRYVVACAVAATGTDEYVVVWWNAARDEPRHSILAASVRAVR